jgi:hypothetical protein
VVHSVKTKTGYTLNAEKQSKNFTIRNTVKMTPCGSNTKECGSREYKRNVI